MPVLPRLNFPNAKEMHLLGVQDLPIKISSIDFEKIAEFRSKAFTTSGVKDLDLAKLVAASFCQNEPMNRHIYPPKDRPQGLNNAIHRDPFGTNFFGVWTKENIFYWFLRLFVLTNPTSPLDAIELNEDLIKLSFVLRDQSGSIVGVAFNITFPIHVEETFRNNDSFIRFVEAFIAPPLSLIIPQEQESIDALYSKYSEFEAAHQSDKVGYFFMIAKSENCPSQDVFELVASSAEKFKNLGFQYMVTSASNEWTGAAFEAMGATRVHFSPFRNIKRVMKSEFANRNEVHSADGYVSDKDSGVMMYVIGL